NNHNLSPSKTNQNQNNIKNQNKPTTKIIHPKQPHTFHQQPHNAPHHNPSFHQYKPQYKKFPNNFQPYSPKHKSSHDSNSPEHKIQNIPPQNFSPPKAKKLQ
ncbi:MAG: hypothetical protein MI922_17030, partial [Bacteroidales bacterium]|nr:hypothetical protein [Bacteroidales bacterium]